VPRTLEQIRQKIRNNFPKETQSRREIRLEWNRESMTTVVSTCRTYRISKMEDPLNKGVYGYALSLVATPTTPNKHLSGPFLLPRDARSAAQAHHDGMPLQADLA
jgi:hypothetical protein